ncbi:hypothetical protein QYG89_16140 [Bacillus sp. B190/17]|uniref:DUF8096 domain-containing protein n=1 Tax=Bacillus lumedeiriae TaxID=3058829 RepID=A0ABW8IDB7_9BACI
MNLEVKKYDLTIIYDYKEHPDILSGHCNNCENTPFKSPMKNNIFLRECCECNMKKSI